MIDARAYWLPRLARIKPTPPPLWPASADDPPAEAMEVELDARTVQRLHELTKGAPLLVHAVVVAATHALLHVRTGVQDVFVGSPARVSAGARTAPNTLPIVQQVTADTSFRDLLFDVRRSLLDAFALQDVPCRPLLEETLIRGIATLGVVVELEGFTGPPDGMPELSIRARVDSARASLRFESSGAAARSALRNFAEQLAHLIAEGVNNQTSSVRELAASLRAEQARMLEWNATAGAVPPGTVVSWMESVARQRPEAPALIGAGLSMSYGELNRKAHRLARELRRQGVGPEARVGLYLAEPAAMIVALFAVLKAGGVYVPLDPAHPAARIQKMIADAKPLAIVVEPTSAGAERLGVTEAAQLVFDVAENGAEDAADELGEIRADQLAYIIYTSGTTGEPRGVLVTHASVANTIHWFANRIGVNEHSRVSQICSFNFDAAALEVFLALTRGARLCIAPRDARLSGPALGTFLRDHSITTIGAITSSVLALIDREDGASVRAINVGAEKCPAALADRWGPGRLLLNCYGPTEATIDCMCGPCPGGEGDPPLGRPIANATVHILDANMEPVPIGAVGEIYAGGVAVARGYSNRPDLTAERFVPDPFEKGNGARLYRTGDLGRRRPDGRIDFVGRDDRQIKIDGLRIELGEIEAALKSHPGVRNAVAELVTDEGGSARVAAYVVAPAGSLAASELRAHLAGVLPAYMLPSFILALDRLPLTINGKLDRKALQELARQRKDDDTPPPPSRPTTEIEQRLARIWGEILRAEPKSPYDNFFDLGGRSLDVTRVMSKVAREFDVELPLPTMFESPTLGGLAEAVTEALGAATPRDGLPALLPLPPRPAALPLSCSQERLWFMHQVLPVAAAALYNGPMPVRLKGKVNTAALAASFREIVRRHESLRTAFHSSGEQPVQRVLDEVPFEIEPIDLSELDSDEQPLVADRIAAADARSPFDLERPPLLRAKLVRFSDSDHLLLLNIHHIVFDGWSSGVLLDELSRLYAAFSRGEPSPLQPLPLQYADFALWQRRCLQDPRMTEQLAYWRRQLSGLPELVLPTDAERPATPSYVGAVESFRIDGTLRDRLKAFGRQMEATLFMTLLAGFNALLFRYTTQTDIVVSSPVANRNRAELEGLIGFFVNSLVLRTDLSGDPSFRTLLARVRRVTLDAYDNQDLPFERLVEELRPERVATWNPLFRAAFSLQNVPQSSTAPPGLTIVPLQTHNRTAKFDLVVALIETDEGLEGDVEYSGELFERATIRELIERYSRLLAGVLEQPDVSLLEIPLAAVPAAARAATAQTCTTFDF